MMRMYSGSGTGGAGVSFTTSGSAGACCSLSGAGCAAHDASKSDASAAMIRAMRTRPCFAARGFVGERCMGAAFCRAWFFDPMPS